MLWTLDFRFKIPDSRSQKPGMRSSTDSIERRFPVRDFGFQIAKGGHALS
jgi:hypothetical protein